MRLTTANMGKVVIAGAGPGDPELLTVKALRSLQSADVVLTDRLVSQEILNCYVNPKAEVVYVGKQCRNGKSTPQSAINDLMVRYANEGRMVVRLKGGDVSIFSNILDELQVLASNNIPYEIIPGVTAAFGAAAYAGIPLTARGLSTAVRFITYYRSDVVTNEYWKELALSDDTLVFYMSAETIHSVVAHLLKNDIQTDKMIAVIGQATTPEQQVFTSSLQDFARIGSSTYISPTIIIIGRVVALHKEFKWLSNNETPKEYFTTVRTEIKID